MMIFVKRQVPAGNEVTIRIFDDAGIVFGEIIAPEGVSISGTVAADPSEQLGVHQALAAAIEMAEEHDLAVGVIDDHGLWKEEWGDLRGGGAAE